jgi:DNA-binding transcriptional ArsR family regulator
MGELDAAGGQPMSAPAEDVDAPLRALADANRRRILAVVRDQPRAVGEIAEQVAMSQQAVSFHLRVLRGAGLVTERHERTRHLFVVRTDGLRAVREFLDTFWPTHLAALKQAAEAEARRNRSKRRPDG